MRKKGLAILALMFMIMLYPASAVAQTATVSPYTGNTYTHNDVFKDRILVNGIDVSAYQDNIDWNRVKADGVDFAIIRVGGRGYGAAGRTYIDGYYRQNIENAKKAGVMVGIYYFSQAITEAEAIEEANIALELLGSYDIELPIFMDYEYAKDNANPGRLITANLSKEQATANAEAFCKTIEAAGHEAGIYANLMFLNDSIDGKALGEKYFIWEAQYNNQSTYQYTYDMWQYSSSGNVSGIGTRTDCDFWYLNKTADATQDKSIVNCQIRVENVTYSAGKNHEPAVEVTYNGKSLKKGVDYKVGYVNNSRLGTAYAFIKGIGEYTDYQTVPFEINKISKSRIYGKNRYETAIANANEFKRVNGTEKFDSIIIAAGDTYADALSGTYLAKIKNAPILLVGNDTQSQKIVKDYLTDNLNNEGTVYILGGAGAVSSTFESKIKSYNIKRLCGQTRFETNLEILKECGITNEDILVCSGMDFADGLSSSACGRPILLVDKKLTAEQQKYLKSLTGNKYYIIGGTGAVNSTVEKGIKSYGSAERVYGKNRYSTSVAVAKKFFGYSCNSVVIAYGLDFPDGLSAGPLAVSMNAPLILATTDNTVNATGYIKTLNINRATVLGGPTLISDRAVKKILSE